MNEEITKQTEGTPSGAQVVEVLPPDPDRRALNASTHGMTAQHVRPDEREAYAQHVEQVRASTGAQGYLEQRLADRAAAALWRLDRVTAFEAARSNDARRELLKKISEGERHGPAQHVTAAYDALHRLIPWNSAEELRAAPQIVEREAQQIEDEAAFLVRVAQGGSAEVLSIDEADVLGRALAELLTMKKVSAAQMVRAMMGRPARRGEAASVEDGEWTFEPGEVPGLLRLYREHLGAFAADALSGYAARHRLTADRVREAHREALSAEHDALALAALPRAEVLEKVTRYEAHLERVLYRALHDLEAARLGRQGKESPPPLRGVLDELTPSE